MQIELQLSGSENSILPFDYYHELASAFYSALEKSYPDFAHNLHDGEHFGRMKLFVFSPLNSDPHPRVIHLSNGQAALQFGSRIWMRFASIWPELLYYLAESLQRVRVISVRGRNFAVKTCEMVPTPNFLPSLIYRPFGQASCIVCPYTVDGKSRFQMPDDSENGIPSCRELIAGNLRHKLLRLRDVRPDIFENITTIANLDTDAISQLPITVEFLPLKENCSYRTLLYRLKGHNIRGFRAPVQITAPEAIHRIVWDCGLGACNSMGYGMVELGRNTSCC